ncbi:uncharacterized protein LOC121400934 [Xenopus laevis]|uniref:1-alkyl-2-acetylglycerophosphocholine esterase n=1 Tax=Xenopus laevis TaxID=8355 RepID=A0A8J1MHE4_XENLA|nr:uncharacterized protein LOC121400934 [Xenopus laevis]
MSGDHVTPRRRSRSSSIRSRRSRYQSSRSRSRSHTHNISRGHRTAHHGARSHSGRASVDRTPHRERDGGWRTEHSRSCLSFRNGSSESDGDRDRTGRTRSRRNNRSNSTDRGRRYHRCHSSISHGGVSRSRSSSRRARVSRSRSASRAGRHVRSRPSAHTGQVNAHNSTSHPRSMARQTAQEGPGAAQEVSPQLASLVTVPEVSTAPGPGGGSISVWLLGHSYISWARRRAAVKNSGPQLGFPEGRVNIHWFGVPGLRWPGVWPTLLRHVRSGRRPDVLLIHAGGNDMGLRSQRELVLTMKQDLDRIRGLFPDLILVWSEMVPRLVWRYARNGDKMDKSRVKVNKLMASFVRKFGGIVVRHSDLDDKMPDYFSQDGVHLSELGNSFFTLALMEGIERALGLLSGGSCRA